MWDRTSAATCGRTASMTTSLSSSTAWLDAATVMFENFAASAAATPALRGETRIVSRPAPAAFRPVTIAEVIAPVPTNPSLIPAACSAYTFSTAPPLSAQSLKAPRLRTSLKPRSFSALPDSAERPPEAQ